MSRPRLLDLFCGEGGAGAGYTAAGFDVTGIDIAARGGRYPGRFHRADALRYLAAHGAEFDAVHASPPCQSHSLTRSLPRSGPPPTTEPLFPLDRHPDLVDATRAALIANGRPWVIENVPGAPLVDPVVLCGSMFPRLAVCVDGELYGLRRHRLFESSLPLTAPGPCRHRLPALGVYGRLSSWSGKLHRANLATYDQALALMECDWMTAAGVALAIPPAYTEWLGGQLIAAARAAA